MLLAASSIAWGQATRTQCVANADRLIASSPRDANAYVTRALCYMPDAASRSTNWSDLQVAVKDLETALKLEPNNFYGRHNYGQAAYLLNHDEFAVQQFSLALRLNPNSARTFQGRGWAYLKACRFNEAQRDFEQALRLDAARGPELATASDIASQRTLCAARPATPAIATDSCDTNAQASCRARLARMPGIVYRDQWLENCVNSRIAACTTCGRLDCGR
jgi:tetratricopeptide (TPR) repeat protein